jgi:hypothetical protein
LTFFKADCCLAGAAVVLELGFLLTPALAGLVTAGLARGLAAGLVVDLMKGLERVWVMALMMALGGGGLMATGTMRRVTAIFCI